MAREVIDLSDLLDVAVYLAEDLKTVLSIPVQGQVLTDRMSLCNVILKSSRTS